MSWEAIRYIAEDHLKSYANGQKKKNDELAINVLAIINEKSETYIRNEIDHILNSLIEHFNDYQSKKRKLGKNFKCETCNDIGFYKDQSYYGPSLEMKCNCQVFKNLLNNHKS